MTKFEERYISITNKIQEKKIVDWCLLLVSIVLVVTNIVRCDNCAFIPDECYTVKLSTWNWGDIIRENASDFHPPLYHLMTTLIYRLFGWAAPLYRLFSVFPWVVEVILINVILKKIAGPLVSLFTVLMISLTWSSLYYTINATCYTWASLFVLCTFLALYYVFCDAEKKIAWICLVAFASLAAYTHYYALLYVAIMLGIAVVLMLVSKNDYLRKMLTAIGICIVLYLPWLYVAVGSYTRLAQGDSWLKETYMSLSACFLSWYSWDIVVVAALVGGLIFVFRYCANPLVSMKDCERNWILVGIGTLIFSILVPKTLMLFVGNLLVMRYLFPLITVAAIILAMTLIHMKYGKVYLFLLTIIVTILGSDTYKAEVYSENMANMRQCEFMENVILDNDAFIVGDALAFTWSILGYYYPSNYCCGLEDWLNEYDPKTSEFSPESHVLFLYYGMKDEIMKELDSKGLTVEYMYTGTIGSLEGTEVYRVERK